MTKTKIGSQEFTASGFDVERFRPLVPGVEDDYFNRLHAMIEGNLPKSKRFWDCPNGPWAGTGSKGVFRKVEPRMHFFSYPGYPGYTPKRKEITEATMRLLRDFGKLCGFKNAAELTEAVFTDFGVRDVPFDGEDVLTEAEKAQNSYRLAITLKFVHFSLHSPMLKTPGLVVISVPDRLVFDRRRTHSCGPTGKTRLPDYAYNHSEKTVLVRSATGKSHELRRMKLDQEIARQKAEIEAARKRIAELEGKIERMGSGSAPSDGD